MTQQAAVDTELVQILMDAGFVATGSGRHSQAEIIFNGLAAARPESELPWIGLAVVLMNTGKSEEAAVLLQDKGLQINPDSCLARSFLGLAHKLSGHGAEAERVLNSVVADCPDQESSAAMAQALLAELQDIS
jgi:Flp pilus assembly protein TadD